jgi:ABC-type lipoprotein release transport system permease subunit
MKRQLTLLVLLLAPAGCGSVAGGEKPQQPRPDLAQQLGISLIVMRADALNPMTGRMDERVGREIAALDGVRDVCPGLVAPISFDNLGQQGIIVQGWPPDAFMFGELKVLEGKKLSTEFRGKRGIMLGKDLARNAKLSLGSEVEMSDEKYHVLGIFEGVGMDNFRAVLLLEDAQQLMDYKGKITECTVRLKDNSEQAIKAVQAQIEGPVAAKLGLAGKIRATEPAHP